MAVTEWRKIKDFPQYEVSNDGRVRSRVRQCPPKVLKNDVRESGYHYVHLGRNGRNKAVHLLMLEAFVGPRPACYRARFKDGNRNNLRLTNLEWTKERAWVS